MLVFILNSARATVRVTTNNNYYDKRIAVTNRGHGANDCARVLK